MSTKAMKLALDALEACINELVDEHNETDTDCTACRAVGQARKAIAALRQAIAQPEQVPAGYKLVPIEPTQAMCQAGQETAVVWPKFPLRISPIYKAMLEAAPEVKP